MDEKGLPPPYSGQEQGVYPPPTQGYPPPQEYPPPQGYPPGYPPQGYPPQGYQLYPPQGYPPQGYPQAQSTNVVVVQPSAVNTTVTRVSTGDYYLTLSIVVAIICFVCVGLPALVCTIPAIFLSLAAKEEASRGNLTAAQQKANISLCLNISAVVCGILFYVVIIGLIVGINASVASSRYYYYSSSYSYG